MNSLHTHVAHIDGHDPIYCNAETFDAACKSLKSRFPTHTPKVDTIERFRRRIDAIEADHAANAGSLRSHTDATAARDAGFSPRTPWVARGAIVTNTQAAKARLEREKWEALPEANIAALDLAQCIDAEERKDAPVPVRALRMAESGDLALPGQRLAIDRRAFGSLTQRIGMPSGAVGYLSAVSPKLRAINVNRFVSEESPKADETVILRTRNLPEGQGREAFGVVSDSYTEFDVDRISRAIAQAAHPSARAETFYDGSRARWRILFHSTVKPEHYVAGEFFRAGVSVSTDDTGHGGIRIEAMVWQHLCLNMVLIDANKVKIANLRHIGESVKLQRRFEEAFAKANEAIGHFVRQWDEANETDIRRSVLQAANVPRTPEVMSVRDFLPGLFNGMIERDLVPLPKRNREATIANLVAAYESDRSSAVRGDQVRRTGVVNAITRYAQDVSPWKQDEIQRAAYHVLQHPTPYPYLPLSA